MSNHVLASSAAWPRLRVTLRELALLAGFLGLMAAGIYNLVLRSELGVAYLAAGLVGGAFIHRRLLPAGIWLTAAAWAMAGGLGGNGVELVLVPLGLVAAGVSLLPVNIVWGTQEPVPAPVAADLPASDATDRVELGSNGHSGPPATAPLSATPSSSNGSAAGAHFRPGIDLRIRTIGRLQVVDAEAGDLTRPLVRKHVLSFLWAAAVVGTLAESTGTVSREAMRELMAAKSDGDYQQVNFHKQFYDLKNDLPESLGRRMAGTETAVWFELAGCELDLLQLRTLAAAVKGSAQPLEEKGSEEIASLLRQVGDGRFLTEYEELKRRALKAKNLEEPPRQVVVLRQEADRLRSELAEALSVTLQMRGHYAEAIDWLRLALRFNEARAELADRIVDLYLKLGRPEEAQAFRRQFDASELV